MRFPFRYGDRSVLLCVIKILEEIDDGVLEGEPEAKNTCDLIFKDMVTVDAVLTCVADGQAYWQLEPDETVCAGIYEQSAYGVLYEKEFHQWLLLIKEVFGNGKDDICLSIPGKLTLSRNLLLVIGWIEDENHPDSMMLLTGEIMSS